MRNRLWFKESTDELGKVHTHSFSFLPTNDPKAPSCDPPICTACRLSRMTTRSTKVKRSQPLPDKFMNLKQDDLLPGDVVSLYQHQSSIKGRLPNTQGREKSHQQYCGGSIGVDHVISYILHRHQVSLRAHDTIKTKHIWEHEARQCDINVKSYHSDNGIFVSDLFTKEL